MGERLAGGNVAIALLANAIATGAHHVWIEKPGYEVIYPTVSASRPTRIIASAASSSVPAANAMV